MTQTASPLIDTVTGDDTGLAIPAHGEALRSGGAAWLTQAFRAFGALPADNAVARITRLDPCPGGSTGQKFYLTVEYARHDPALHRDLFVKFSRDFTDERRDGRGRWEMEAEVRLAALSRRAGFPIDVPAAYFADYHHASGTGVLITQTIAFGRDGIEPHHLKCMDHKLAQPLPYYRATVTALARLAAAHQAGNLPPDVATRFPFAPETAGCDPILYSEAELRDVVTDYRTFAARCPQLLPEEIRTPAFIDQLERDALRIRAAEATIQRYLLDNPDLIALCHWNAHIDNAWFWRDAGGEFRCGLMDWGRVGQITMGAALWGCLSAAHHDVWDDHLDELLELFVREYAAHGGPVIAAAELELHLLLNIACMGTARVLAFPEVVLFRLPAATTASGPQDPIFEQSDPARNSLHIFTVCLKLWRARNFGAQLDALLARLD